jgi:hypothetical protein
MSADGKNEQMVAAAIKQARDAGRDYWIDPKTNEAICLPCTQHRICKCERCPFCSKYVSGCTTVYGLRKNRKTEKGESMFVHKNWWLCIECGGQSDKIFGSLEVGTVTLRLLAPQLQSK